MAFQFSPFENFRRTNILSPRQQPPTPPRTNPLGAGFFRPQEQQQQESQTDPYSDEMQNLLKPSPGLSAYKQYLTTMPNREDYKPGAYTRIASALSGAAAGLRDPGKGIETAMNLNQSAYRSAMEDYANRGVGLKETAGIEQDERAAQIKAIQEARAMGLKYDEFKYKQLHDAETTNQKWEEIQTARQRAQAYIKKMGEQNYDRVENEDGSAVYVNKANPSDRIVMPATPGVRPLGAARLANEQAQTRISGYNANTQRGQLGVSQANSWWNMNQPPSAATPGDQASAMDLALKTLVRDPRWSQFVTIDDGKVSVNPQYMGTPQYKVFQEKLKSTARGIIEGQLFTGDDEPEPPPNIGPYDFRRKGGG
jgi:hypothetical protein